MLRLSQRGNVPRGVPVEGVRPMVNRKTLYRNKYIQSVLSTNTVAVLFGEMSSIEISTKQMLGSNIKAAFGQSESYIRACKILNVSISDIPTDTGKHKSFAGRQSRNDDFEGKIHSIGYYCIKSDTPRNSEKIIFITTGTIFFFFYNLQ